MFSFWFQTLEHSVLPQLGQSPGCTWAGFNPQIGLYKRKGWERRGPQRGAERRAPLLAVPVQSQSVDQMTAPLKFHVGLVMLSRFSLPFTPSLKASRGRWGRGDWAGGQSRATPGEETCWGEAGCLLSPGWSGHCVAGGGVGTTDCPVRGLHYSTFSLIPL